MTRYTRKKGQHGYSAKGKQLKTKRRNRDLDEIDKDLEPKNADNLLNQPVDIDVAGCAQHYCLHCASATRHMKKTQDSQQEKSVNWRYFIDERAMQDHFRTKVHKRRLKALEMEPYSIQEAEAAGGVGTYIQPKKRKMKTQQSKE